MTTIKINMPDHNNRKRSLRNASVMLRNIPRDLRDKFKSYCANRGLNMTEMLVAFMKQCVHKDEEK